MKIYAPVKNASGNYCSVRFVYGVGETDKPHLIEWFKDHGYKVEEISVKPAENILEEVEQRVEQAATVALEIEVEDVGEVNQPVEPNLESMTPNEIRDWAKANGYGSIIKNTRNKEKLIELLRG